MAAKKAKASEKTESTESAQQGEDRPDDPLFVPHLELPEFSIESADGDGDPYEFILESICGAVDDSQPVEQYDGSLGVTAAFVDTHQAPVCQVQWNDNLASVYTNPGNVSGVRWGTGTMITDDIMITCGHLFDQTGGGWQRPRVNGTTNIISPEEIARNMKVNFNFQVDPSGTMRTEQSFAILELVEYRLGSVDMAICRIDGNPGATFGTASLSTVDASPPDMICIIGHPAGQPKRIEAGPTTSIQGDRIRYNDIDTMGGNSGSGIIRAQDGRLVGVHTNGGCNAASPGPGGGSNFGLRIEKFIDVSPTLQGLTRPKLKFIDDPGGGKFKAIDDIKFKFRDDVKAKFRDDIKFKFSDDGKLKQIDDVKNTFLDKGFDVPGGLGRFGSFGEAQGASGQRPFILSTPHHAYPGGGQPPSEAADIEATLEQLAALIEAGVQEIEALQAAYQQLWAEYEAAQGDA